MSNDLKLELIEDSRMVLHDKIPFPVQQGSASVNPMSYAFNTKTPSTQSVVIQCPSLDNITDLNIMVRGKMTFTVTATTTEANQAAIQYGCKVSNIPAGQPGFDTTFNSFPYNRLLQTITAQINNTSVTVNSANIVSSLLEYVSREELSNSNCMTPMQLNNYAVYGSGADVANSVYKLSNASIFQNYLNSYDWKNASNAAYPAVVVNQLIPGGGGVTTNTITIEFCEPILGLSPLLFGDKGGSGIRGVNNIVLSMVTDPTAKQALKYCGVIDAANYAVGVSFSDMYADVTFLTAKPFQLAKYGPRCVQEYCENDVYITNGISIPYAINSPFKFTTAAVQLSSIPKAVILSVRPLLAAQTYRTSDCKFPIQTISGNFNSMNGLLSGASTQQLFRMNSKNGSQLSYTQWSGQANVNGAIAATAGGSLCLSFVNDINIPESYLAPASLGQYTMSFTVNGVNNIGTPDGFPINTPIPVELVMIVISDGAFSSSAGISEKYTSLLTKEAVMSVLNQEPKVDAGNDKSSEFENVGQSISGGRRMKRHQHKKHHMRLALGEGEGHRARAEAEGEARHRARAEAEGEARHRMHHGHGDGEGLAFGEAHYRHRSRSARGEGKAYGEGEAKRHVGRPRKSATGEARRKLSRRVKF